MDFLLLPTAAYIVISAVMQWVVAAEHVAAQ